MSQSKKGPLNTTVFSDGLTNGFSGGLDGGLNLSEKGLLITLIQGATSGMPLDLRECPEIWNLFKRGYVHPTEQGLSVFSVPVECLSVSQLKKTYVDHPLWEMNKGKVSDGKRMWHRFSEYYNANKLSHWKEARAGNATRYRALTSAIKATREDGMSKDRDHYMGATFDKWTKAIAFTHQHDWHRRTPLGIDYLLRAGRIDELSERYQPATTASKTSWAEAMQNAG